LNYERAAEAARVTINQWVEDKTRHKITDLIGPGVLNALTRMVLVNAIYFKGTWATPFPASATRPARFYARPNRTLTVPFMHQHGSFRYGENDQLQILALPYAGQQLEMLVLLPRSRDGIASLESSLTPVSLAAWTAGMRQHEVNVAVPRFKVSSGISLAETLKAMGLNDAFDPSRADFSGLDGRARWLYLSAVLHKAYVEVNEQGTEAAAATAVVVGVRSVMRKDPPREFRADHPFVFLIRDVKTASILFAGRVTTPGE
jgi:serpin B